MRLNNLRDDYTLLEAFEVLGEWLYGDEWTGNEQQIESSRVVDPEEMRAAQDAVGVFDAAPLPGRMWIAEVRGLRKKSKRFCNLSHFSGRRSKSAKTMCW